MLNQGYNAWQIYRLEEEDQNLNNLVEFTIRVLAEVEENCQSPFLDRLREIRRRVRRFLKDQSEIRRKLTGKTGIGLLSQF